MFHKNTLKLFLLVGISLLTLLFVFSNASKGSPNPVPTDISRQVIPPYKASLGLTAGKGNACPSFEKQGTVKKDKDEITSPASLPFHLPNTEGQMMKLLPIRMRG